MDKGEEPRDDYLLLYYGYMPMPKDCPAMRHLQPPNGGPPVYPLLSIDTNKALIEPWATDIEMVQDPECDVFDASSVPLDRLFEGSIEEMQAEIQRLQRILKQLQDREKEVPTPNPLPDMVPQCWKPQVLQGHPSCMQGGGQAHC
eukprot:gene2949-12957_t